MNQQRNRWPLQFCWGVLALAVVVVGCGGGSDSAAEAEEPQPQAATTTAAADSVEAGEKLNLNTATREAFLTIPNVGDRMVGEFFEYRPYVSIQQFRREIGKYVDEEQVAAYEQYVYVPVDPNESDAATLQQLPGVDATEADELIAGRPYDSDEAFLNRLGDYVSDEELTVAESYLDAQ